MEKTVLMHVSKSKKCLVHYTFDLYLWEVLGAIFHELVDVLLHILEDKVEVVVDSNYLLQLHDVRVVQLP